MSCSKMTFNTNLTSSQLLFLVDRKLAVRQSLRDLLKKAYFLDEANREVVIGSMMNLHLFSDNCVPFMGLQASFVVDSFGKYDVHLSEEHGNSVQVHVSGLRHNDPTPVPGVDRFLTWEHKADMVDNEVPFKLIVTQEGPRNNFLWMNLSKLGDFVKGGDLLEALETYVTSTPGSKWGLKPGYLENFVNRTYKEAASEEVIRETVKKYQVIVGVPIDPENKARPIAVTAPSPWLRKSGANQLNSLIDGMLNSKRDAGPNFMG